MIDRAASTEQLGNAFIAGASAGIAGAFNFFAQRRRSALREAMITSALRVSQFGGRKPNAGPIANDDNLPICEQQRVLIRLIR